MLILSARITRIKFITQTHTKCISASAFGFVELEFMDGGRFER